MALKSKFKKIDLTKTTLFSVRDRKNLVRIDNLANLSDAQSKTWTSREMSILIEKIVNACKNNAPVSCFIGAHVIKLGLSRFLIAMIKEKILTNIATNGAGSIHDFELAYLGGTSEDVPTSIEDGSFGMWKETGIWMNEALQEGYKNNLGYGESLAVYMDNNKEKFPYLDDCVLYQAWKHNVPMTYHITMGTDIIHQSTNVDFSVLGGTSGEDFKIFCNSIKNLENGVHMNIGSSVTGPEVFLKALSIVRNQKYKVEKITTANFDIIPLGDYKSNVSDENFHYYYRPRKNVINRPTSLGGTGLYIEGNHKDTIPVLYREVHANLK